MERKWGKNSFLIFFVDVFLGYMKFFFYLCLVNISKYTKKEENYGK
jgi:hypothetical protein